MARKFISYNGRIVSDNLTLKLLGQDVSSGPQCGDTPFTNTKSIEFDGMNDFVDCGDNDNLSFGNGVTDSPFSISAWIKIGQTISQGIVTKYGSTSATREWLFYITGGKLRLLLWGNGTNNIATGTTNLATNTWYHVVCTYDGRGGSTAYNGMTLYINGVAESVTTSGGAYTAMSNTNQNVEIGKHLTNELLGNIDETAIFNIELSASDVTTIYNGGIPNDLCTLNPLSWWRMGDGDTFPTLTDNGSGGNDGTMTNMSSGNIVEDVPPSDWAPTNVNTVAWIDASDTGSYTTAGSTLTSVTDKAGTYTMNIGNTPTVVTGGLNSLNVFDFDGNGEYLQSSTYSNQTSSGNHWAVGVFLADFVDGDKDSFWSYETNQSPKRDYAVSSAGGGSNSWPGELDLDALSSNRISSTIGNKQDWNLQSVSIDSWVIVSGWFNKTGNQIGNRVNGNNAYTPVNDYDNSISPNQELRLMRNRASQELDGRLAEFFAVADLPGTGGTDLTDLEKAEGYLAWKWGLEGNLPVSHPYKNSPPTV